MVLSIDAPKNFEARKARSGTHQASRHSARNPCVHQSAARVRFRRVASSMYCLPRRCEFPPATLRVFFATRPAPSTHVLVKATRCAPFSSPVKLRSSLSSATVRFGFKNVSMLPAFSCGKTAYHVYDTQVDLKKERQTYAHTCYHS